MPDDYTFKPICFFRSSKKQNLEASCQGVLDENAVGEIDLSGFPQWKAMLQGIEGFSHLWIVFIFHQSEHRWKPMVLPPRADHKVGVFASRSPYRPNPIGISAVKIERIEGAKIFVSGHDLVNETPILDIKPYLAYADSFPEATSGWIQSTQEYEVVLDEQAHQEILFLKNLGLVELESTLRQQLRFQPTDRRRKRVALVDETSQSYVFSYRTWRIQFCLVGNKITVTKISSGYNREDLDNPSEDPYQDKQVHLKFLEHFSKF